MRSIPLQKILLALILIIDAFLIWMLIIKPQPSSNQVMLPELSKIKGDESFSQLADYFQNLANKKGAVYAYKVLKVAPVAAGTDMHLMGHVVGEILYKQKGASGIQFCTQDFRNACSHTIVVGLFTDRGVDAISEIKEACKKAPGGKGAYNMCFHGLGHGVLSYSGYDLVKAVKLCSELKKQSLSNREYPECVGGAIMEIISGGDHDKSIWLPKHEEYMGTKDPLYPCDSEIIPTETKELCFTYLTPHLIQFGGGSFGLPTDEDIKSAFNYCKVLSEDDPNRRVCLAEFGKEFVVLAKLRDIRNVGGMTKNEMGKILNWCKLADEDSGQSGCIISALNSIYWGGENDRGAAIKFCNEVDLPFKDNCFNRLIGNVSFFIDDSSYKKSFCSEIPSKYLSKCKKIYEA